MNIFLISDTHFGHENILRFKRPDGNPVRDFSSVEEMDEYMVDKWNSVVKPEDHVYHLGDVAMHKLHIPTIGRCNGHKRLVLGNHDEYRMELYKPYFEKIFSSRRLDTFILSHIPLHPESLGRFVNAHGHVHNSVPQGHLGPRYYNVSVEVLNYTPIALEDLKKLIPSPTEEV